MRAALILLALMAVAAASQMASPLRAAHAAKKSVAPGADPCTGHPCGPTETCCTLPGNQAGCCPAAKACCCPDQAHCCTDNLKCTCTGTCPGSNCQCTACAADGKCESSIKF
eukprot:TRINITY_DN10_c0_g1_i1.p2 TRINITY_DN10_c0_g1~~TRINITY_DN10_c0_g1_i1.p2  ORF type:complete len:112 (+),score=22.40 TRINITY_DN10_c0_g1_i1:77-412(+)